MTVVFMLDTHGSNEKGCEFHGPGSFAPGRKDPGLVLQYL